MYFKHHSPFVDCWTPCPNPAGGEASQSFVQRRRKGYMLFDRSAVVKEICRQLGTSPGEKYEIMEFLSLNGLVLWDLFALWHVFRNVPPSPQISANF